ncbi:MAG: DUF4390 domain-containing protein [Candidatus Zixiibacteriota bacterium]|nr:MAG: DUF4390 domain-containing protein [candidate division Zixibacteria bacterium]
MRFRQINLILIVSFLALYSVSNAVNLEFSSIEFEGGMIAAKLQVSDSLPAELMGYIKKGVPISFEYKMELWESRAGWLDRRLDNKEIIHNLRYDTWENEYTILSRRSDLTIENQLEEDREATDLVKSSGLLKMTLKDTSGQFYITGKLTIKTMSLTNLKEVESWLKGEISGAKKPDIKDAPDKFGEFLFNTALKISGLKNVSEEIRSPFFVIESGKIVFPERE